MPNINELPIINNADNISDRTYFLTVDNRLATRVSLLAVEKIMRDVSVTVFVEASAQNHVAKPLNSTSTGVVGQIAFDTEYVYICVSPSTWRRVPASTF